MYRRRDGFTLIELLVVIAIIGLLISIAAVALSKAKKQAVRMICNNTMHQWGLAVRAYALDHDNSFPCMAKDSILNSYDFCWVSGSMLQYFFPDYLLPLDKETHETKNTVLFCPTDVYHRAAHEDDFDYCVSHGLVGYNVLFGNDQDHLMIDEGPSNYSLPQCPHGLEWLTRKRMDTKYSRAPILADNLQATPNPWNWISDEGVFYSSHADPKNDGAPEGGYFLFEDGHVNWYKGVNDGRLNFGDIGVGGQQRSWHIYFALPDVR